MTRYERDDDKSDELIQETRELIGQMRSLVDGLDRVAEALQRGLARQRREGDR